MTPTARRLVAVVACLLALTSAAAAVPASVAGTAPAAAPGPGAPDAPAPAGVDPAAGAAAARTDAAAGTGAPASTAPVTETPPNATEEGRLTLAYALERLPDRPGLVRVSVAATAPASVTSVTLELPAEARADSASGDGFERIGGGDGDGDGAWRFEPDGDSSARLSYLVAVNRSQDGTREAASVGDWALFNWRTVDPTWSFERESDAAPPPVVERGRAVGEGVVGPAYAYLGPAETYERTVEGETLRLVVPAAAAGGTRASPREALDALAAASRDLDVGARSDRLTVFVAPAPIEAAGRLSRVAVDGRQDALVAADAPLDTPDSPWLHEYVHSRQAYAAGEGLSWLDDGLAEYYAARLALEAGRVSPAEFRAYVRTDRAADAVLADAESVSDAASYYKGMRVLAALDAEVRTASDGDASLEPVFAGLNAADGTVTEAAFARLVADAAGEPRDDWLRRYLHTSDAPPVPDSLGGGAAPAGDADDRAGDAGLAGASPLGTLLFGAGVLAAVVAVRRRRS